MGSPPPLEVHLIPHTHDDVGWLKTVDQYFSGERDDTQLANVEQILDSVVDALLADPSRTFTYVEVAFFERWWRRQTAARKEAVRALVKSGRLEFANGGWCMHDEAATYFRDMVDQTTLGHRFLMQELGTAPRVTWSLDPFGHSATNAALLGGAAGFEAIFFGRADYADLARRQKNRSVEFRWQASPSLGPEGDILGMLYGTGNYGPPDGFCFDVTCAWAGDAPVIDDPALEGYNIPSVVDRFVQRTKEHAERFEGAGPGGAVYFLMGSDFHYGAAGWWYKSLDRLIAAVNADGRLTARYSTPSKYLEARRASLAREGVQLTLKTDDMFPYADTPHAYWTGYFTSRPALKLNVRVSGALLDSARQLEWLAGLAPASPWASTTAALEEAMAVSQHHDAVSGTSKQHVAYDYARRLAVGANAARAGLARALSTIVTGGKVALSSPSFVFCPLLNASMCAPTEGLAAGSEGTVAVLAYNPLAQSRTEYIRVPVPEAKVGVTDGDGVSILAQAVPSAPGVAAPFELVFKAELPPLGFATFFLSRAEGTGDSTHVSLEVPADGIPTTIATDSFALDFDDGRLTKISNAHGPSVDSTMGIFWYNASTGTGGPDDGVDGAYIFRPNGSYPVGASRPALTVVRGPLVQEARQSFGPWASLAFRLHAGEAHADVHFSVGPVPIDDGLGKDVVVRTTTAIASGAQWFTDSNGRDMQPRARNFRPTWELNVTEPVSANYYPVNSAISIRDDGAQLSVVVDRSQGGASLQDGEVELMVHRRLLHDDYRGVGEPLNETEHGRGLVVQGVQKLALDTPSSAVPTFRALQQSVNSPLLLAFASAPHGADGWKESGLATSFHGIGAALPPNVHLLTLQALGKSTVLVRIAHLFEVAGGAGFDPKLSADAQVDLSLLFPARVVGAVDELTLTANRPAGPTIKGATVTIKPMQVRTFRVDLS